jgi:hypothetical protein
VDALGLIWSCVEEGNLEGAKMGAIDMAVCRKVQKEFKSRGLGLKMDAMKAMAEFISNSMQDESELLQEIFAELERRTCEYVPSLL